MRLLTIEEAASYLGLTRRQLYQHVAERNVPCTKLTGRWLFPLDLLNTWQEARWAQSDNGNADPLPIVGGSYDPLLEWALRMSAAGLATLSEGSSVGLARFLRGEIVAAAIHLHSVAEEDMDTNVSMMLSNAKFCDSVLIAFCQRLQGLVVHPGNPLKIGGLNDVVRLYALVATRPKGSGARLLMGRFLARLQVAEDQLNLLQPECPTDSDVVQAVRAGRADCGIAAYSVAKNSGLGFVPLASEHFDLVVRRRDFFRPPFQSFLSFLKTSMFKEQAAESGGYEVECSGSIRFAS